ncbi:MAG: hypothetical protein ABGW89_10020 [Microbacterium sp.]
MTRTVGPQRRFPKPIDTTDSGGQNIRMWLPETTGPAPLIIWCHPQGGTQTIGIGYFAYHLVHAALQEGWSFAASATHGADSWSSNAAVADITNLRAAVHAARPVSSVVLLGASMGGCLASVVAKEAAVPDLRGVYLIDPAVNLEWMYDNGYSTSINTGFGISSKAAIPTGKDPVNDFTGASLPAGLRWRSTASVTDASVSKTNCIDLFRPIIQASSPAEESYFTHLGNHIPSSAAWPADLVAFGHRCFD